MAFFVQKSLLFLLTILLLVCSSHANGDISHLREGDRKLLVFGTLAKGLGKMLAPGVKRGSKSIDVAPPRLPAKFPSKNLGDTVAVAPGELTEITAQRIGETVVGRLFGSDGKRGFRVGWKLGKLYYGLEDKCQKYIPNCKTYNTLTSPCQVAVSCIAIVPVVGNSIDSCWEYCGVQNKNTLCIYDKGVIYFGGKVISIEEARVRCSVK